MNHTRTSDVEPRTVDAAHFTGRATRHDLIVIDEPPSSALIVRFEAGGRTHWHRHPDGQYIYVLEGRGRAQTRGSEPIDLQPGDCVYAAPGEVHWHGAIEDDGLVHLAVSLGVTEWLEPATDESA